MIIPERMEARLMRNHKEYKEQSICYHNTKLPISDKVIVTRATHAEQGESFTLEIMLLPGFTFYSADALEVLVKTKQNGKEDRTVHHYFRTEDIRPFKGSALPLPKRIPMPGQTLGWIPRTDVERWERGTLGKICVTISRVVDEKSFKRERKTWPGLRMPLSDKYRYLGGENGTGSNFTFLIQPAPGKISACPSNATKIMKAASTAPSSLPGTLTPKLEPKRTTDLEAQAAEPAIHSTMCARPDPTTTLANVAFKIELGIAKKKPSCPIAEKQALVVDKPVRTAPVKRSSTPARPHDQAEKNEDFRQFEERQSVVNISAEKHHASLITSKTSTLPRVSVPPIDQRKMPVMKSDHPASTHTHTANEQPATRTATIEPVVSSSSGGPLLQDTQQHHKSPQPQPIHQSKPPPQPEQIQQSQPAISSQVAQNSQWSQTKQPKQSAGISPPTTAVATPPMDSLEARQKRKADESLDESLVPNAATLTSVRPKRESATPSRLSSSAATQDVVAEEDDDEEDLKLQLEAIEIERETQLKLIAMKRKILAAQQRKKRKLDAAS